MKKVDDKKVISAKEIHEEVVKSPIDEAIVWKDKYIRAMADYQNLEKRSRDQLQEARLFASEIVMGRLLPVVDTFTKVQEHVKDVGFDLAYKQMLAVLEEQGVAKMSVLGALFNPHEMECIEVIDGKNDTVLEEVLAGYMFRGKVLRVALVKVGKEMLQSANDKSTNKLDNTLN